MAPEVISPNTTVPAYDEKIDVFSFSILFWEMASGKRAIAELAVKPSDGGEYDLARLRDEIVGGTRPEVKDIRIEYVNRQEIAKLLEVCWNSLPARRPKFSVIKVRTPLLRAVRAGLREQTGGLQRS
jgi:hypothetical protein